MAPITSFVASIMTIVSVASATSFHVNTGCINVEGKAVCQSKENPTTVNGGAANIAARFSGNTALFDDVPGCNARFTWDASFGDVFFGADNCLYDANGNNINGQCCTVPNGVMVRNPYNVHFG